MSDFSFVQKIMFTILMAITGSTGSHTFYTGRQLHYVRNLVCINPTRFGTIQTIFTTYPGYSVHSMSPTNH